MKPVAFVLFALFFQVDAQNIRVTWSGNLATIQWDETFRDSTAGSAEVPFSVLTGPYILWLTDSTARIAWEVIAEKSILDSSPYFAGDSAYPYASKMAVRSAKLNGLKADSAYRYRLYSTNGTWTYTGKEYPFRTLPPPSSTRLRFALIGDTQRGWEHPLFSVYGDHGGNIDEVRKISKLIEAWNPPMVLHMGDIILAADHKNFLSRANWFGVLNNLKFISSSFMAVTQGNHDGPLDPYFTDYRLELPDTAMRPPYYYSFDVGNVHFICLNCCQYARTPQRKWLEKDLMNNKKPWKIAFMHYPIHDVGFHGTSPANLGYSDLFDQYGVQLYLSGHDHNYQRTRRIINDTIRALSDSGTVQVVAASPGSALQFAIPTPSWNLFFSPKAVYMQAEVRDDAVYFAAVDTGGTVIDKWMMPRVGQPITLFDGEPFEMADDRDTMTVKYNDPWTVVDAHSATWTNPSWSSRRLVGGCFRSHSSYSAIAGNFAEFSFTGKSITWIGLKERAGGKADVYIDGLLDQADVDAYAPATAYQQEIYSKSWSSVGRHTIKIVVKGTKNPSATGSNVDIDAFKYAVSPGASGEAAARVDDGYMAPVSFRASSDRLTVRILSGGAYRLAVTDARGRIVKRLQGAGPADHTLSKQGIAAGVYWVKITAGNRRFVRSFVCF